MNLFSRLFRKRQPAPAVPPVPPAEDRRRIERAAIDQLPDGRELRNLAPGSEAARMRLAQLIDAGSIDFTQFCAEVREQSVLFSILLLCTERDRVSQMLASIEDPAHLAALVLSSPSSRVRQLAAARIEEPDQLKILIKQLRNKDKTVYKIIKQKCDALNEADRRAAAFVNSVTELCESLERLSHRAYDASYGAAVDRLALRWESLTERPPVELERRASQALESCKAVLATQVLQLEKEAEAAAVLKAAEDAEFRAQEAARAASREAAEAQSAADAQTLAAADVERDAQERVVEQARAEAEQRLRRIAGLIRQASRALDEGSTQRAAGLRRTLEERLAPPSPVLPAHLARQLQRLDEKLAELKQWKEYAVAPKRIELIEEMEALIGSTDDPRRSAERIKSLQQEWRTVGKGIVGDTPTDWERFHRASEAAYEPCRDYFAAQALLRRENLASRQTLLERLTAVEAQSGVEPDFKLLASVLREAPLEWRRYFPVDRQANRALQQEFDATLGRLRSRLDAWYADNVRQRESLIARARALLDVEDSRAAIESMQGLQASWKASGAVPRDHDQALWSEFREICDAVYKKRQQAYVDYTAGLEANKIKAVALCEEVERVAAVRGPELLEGVAKLAEWRAAFDALDELPRAHARELRERFDRALDACSSRLAEHQAAAEQRALANLFEAGERLQAYEWAVATAADELEQTRLRQAAESFMAGVERWPKGGLQALEERLARAPAHADDDAAARETRLRILCIRGEIYREMRTPPEDQSLRRDYQVQRLMQGMGQGTHGNERDWHAMVLEWIRVGAVTPTVHRSLQERFAADLVARPGKV